MSPLPDPPRDNKDAHRARPVAVNAGVHGQRYAHFKTARRALRLCLLLLLLWETEYLSGSESPWGCFRINLNATSVFHLALTIEDIDVGSASQNTTASGCKFQNKAPVSDEIVDSFQGKTIIILLHHRYLSIYCFVLFLISCYPPPPPYSIIDSGHPWSGSGQVAGNNQELFLW